MKRAAALVLVMLAMTASAAVDAREGPKTQWAPTRNFSSLNARAVFAGESRRATSPYAGEAAKTAAGAKEAGFTGHRTESTLGLTYAKRRWLDSSTGTWLSRDDIGAARYLQRPNELNPWVYAAGNPMLFWDVDGRAPRLIGKVYVMIGTRGGQEAVYTGSTAQELKARFSKHTWREFVSKPSTKVFAVDVFAEPDVAASSRGTPRSAINEALRAAEETVKLRMAEKYPAAKVLNEAPIVAEGNQALFAERHSVELRGRLKIQKSSVKPGAKVNSILVIQGVQFALEIAVAMKEDRRLRSGESDRFEEDLHVFDDEGGSFVVVQSTKTLFLTQWRKHYVAGEKRGAEEEISDDEAEFWRREGEALFGKVDDNEFVPGLLRQELPSVPIVDGKPCDLPGFESVEEFTKARARKPTRGDCVQ